MNTKYKLIGFLNMFNIIPDFVFPVFESNGDLFFQEGENDKIEKYGIAKAAIRTRIIPVDSNSFSNIGSNMFDISSSPVYAFQTREQIIYGTSSFIRKFLEEYTPENEIIAEEIIDFLENLPKHKNEMVLYSKALYQPEKSTYYGTGRRKTSIARVYISLGTGNIIINNRDIDNYFRLQNLKFVVYQPLQITDNIQKFDVICTVKGGGVAGQAAAVCHGISRALLRYDASLHSILKKAGLLTRDPRMKERKKYGRKAARKASQFSKR